MVDSWYCLDRVVPEVTSQVSKWLEVACIRRALNTRLSSGTSAGTFAVSAGPHRNYQAEAGTKNESDTYFVPVQKKGCKINPHVSNLRSREFLFQGVQVHPLRVDLNPPKKLIRKVLVTIGQFHFYFIPVPKQIQPYHPTWYISRTEWSVFRSARR